MTPESDIISLCAEACDNARMGYLESACMLMDQAIAKWHRRRFDETVDSIAPLLKGGLCERSLKLFREPNASIP